MEESFVASQIEKSPSWTLLSCSRRVAACHVWATLHASSVHKVVDQGCFFGRPLVWCLHVWSQADLSVRSVAWPICDTLLLFNITEGLICVQICRAHWLKLTLSEHFFCKYVICAASDALVSFNIFTLWSWICPIDLLVIVLSYNILSDHCIWRCLIHQNHLTHVVFCRQCFQFRWVFFLILTFNVPWRLNRSLSCYGRRLKLPKHLIVLESLSIELILDCLFQTDCRGWPHSLVCFCVLRMYDCFFKDVCTRRGGALLLDNLLPSLCRRFWLAFDRQIRLADLLLNLNHVDAGSSE